MQHKRENRKVNRIILEHPIPVKMCSIGAQVKYELLTRNVAQTGFFLEFASPGRFPFTPASIMEVWLEIEENNPIFFNGKMARVVRSGDPKEAEFGTGIAIKIVQIDGANEARLRQFLDQKHQEQASDDNSFAS